VKVYLAVTSLAYFTHAKPEDIYSLCSYYYTDKDKALTAYIPKWKDFILDSGIFTYLNGKESKGIDWDKYVDNYAEYIKTNKIKNYVEVDIDKILNLAEVERLRKRLEKKVGWQSMPVWHLGRGYDKWLEICHDYSYICFGAFITDGLKESKYKKIPKFIADARNRKCDVHGLGMTHFNWLKKLKFFSVDSSSWCSGVRYGAVSKFDKDRIHIFPRPANKRFKDYKKVGYHNLNEWTKFIKYADEIL